MSAAAQILPATTLPEAVYLVGVGGMGMAPLAIYLAQAGVTVSGWDDGLRPEVADILRAHGVELTPAPPSDIPLVARSSAIAADHPLVRAAEANGARVLRRGELLAEVVRGRRLLAVVGSHGKTTTTGMLIHLLSRAGFDFSYVLGALFRDDTAPAHYSAESDWVIAEIDESDGTVEGFAPEVTVAVNFDWDHADRYQCADDLRAAFARLFERTRSRVIFPAWCEELSPLAETVKRLPVEASGGFNAVNGQLALAAAHALGAEPPAEALADFPGIRRRQDILAQRDGVTLVADYAHHPTEVAALLEHAGKAWPGRQVVVFQPHRYTRTRQFASDFARVLGLADAVILLPVYAASETPLAGGESEAIARAAGDRWLVIDPVALPAALVAEVDAGPCTVLFIGAGDIDTHARRFARDWSFRQSWREVLSPETRLSLGEPLAPKTTLRVGGPARLYAEPAGTDDLVALIDFARQSNLPWMALGRGSNLIVDDAGFNGLVISLRHESFRDFEVLEGGRVRVGAGLSLKRLCGMAAREGLAGFEFLEGIPGTVGGALRMNAGACGGWIFDVVERVDFLNAEGERCQLGREDFHVEYRRCEELMTGLALGAVLRAVQPEAMNEIRERMDAYAAHRRESQPREPSAGCIFKNPPGAQAGRLIDELGLKGRRVGEAEISGVHANFIINRGEARAADVLALIREIRATARRERGVELEPEALLVGQRWEDVL